MLRSVLFSGMLGLGFSSWGLPVNSEAGLDGESSDSMDKVADDSLLNAMNPIQLLQRLSAALGAIQGTRTEEEYDAAVREAMDNATPEDMVALFGQERFADTGEGPLAELIEQAGSTSSAVVIRVNIASQSLFATYPGGTFGPVPISSARRGYNTLRGVFGPRSVRLERMHYSRKYHHSPMPHSMFYRGGFAIHGTNAIRNLGRPASHGCVRVSPANAAFLYSVVRQNGGNVTIVVR